MEPDRTFRYPFDRRGVLLASAIGMGLVVLSWFASSGLPREYRVDGTRRMALYALAMSVFAYSMSRDRSRAWVRVRGSGLTVVGPRVRRHEMLWDQIASIAPAPGERFGGVTISARDGRSVYVEHGLDRSDELCQMVWNTGRFVVGGKPGWTRWLQKARADVPSSPDADGPGAELDRTFRYAEADGRITRGLVAEAIWGALFGLSIWPESPAVVAAAGGAVALCGVLVRAYLRGAGRRLNRNGYVRVCPTGLTIMGSRGQPREIRWEHIASIAPAPGRWFGGVTISMRNGETVFVEPGIEHSEELAEAIWDTGRFEVGGKSGWSRWVRKVPDAVRAGDAGAN